MEKEPLKEDTEMFTAVLVVNPSPNVFSCYTGCPNLTSTEVSKILPSWMSITDIDIPNKVRLLMHMSEGL